MKLSEYLKSALRNDIDILKNRADAAEKEASHCHEQIRLKQQALYASECPLEAGKSYPILFVTQIRRKKNIHLFDATFQEVSPSGALYFKKAAFAKCFMVDSVWRSCDYPYAPVSKDYLDMINNLKAKATI